MPKKMPIFAPLTRKNFHKMRKEYKIPTLEIHHAQLQDMLLSLSNSFGDDNGHYGGSDEEEEMSTKAMIWEEEEL